MTRSGDRKHVTRLKRGVDRKRDNDGLGWQLQIVRQVPPYCTLVAEAPLFQSRAYSET